MASSSLLGGVQRTAPAPAPALPACDCPPPCPACGGLECLCRPRFFPGQVLRDDDLTRLENYIIGKNRLHNRHFHGAGVVCGLEVVCDRCTPGNVTVKTGYALSPCGDDIVVCKDASVNVCDLIQRCRPKSDHCDPYGFQPPRDCAEGIQRWVLSVCYDETPSRGVQPLMSEPCGCDGGGGACGCGGGSGGCGCGGNATRPANPKTTVATKYNPQCEPTLICEGFSFTATKYTAAKADVAGMAAYGVVGLVQSNAQQFGPLLTRLMTCFLTAKDIRATFTQPVTTNAQQIDIAGAYADYVDALQAFADAHASHRCDLLRRLACIERPSFKAASVFLRQTGGQVPVDEQLTAADWTTRYAALDDLLLEAVRDCFCSALLPPCPGPQAGNCVPLAVVTINADTCEVLEICNWTARQFALTLPTIAYWTSFINWSAIQQSIGRLCCGDMDIRLWEALFAVLERSVTANAGVQPNSGAQFTTSATLATRSDATASASADTVGSTYGALLGLVEQAARPDGMARMLAPASTPAAVDLADLKATVAALQSTVTAQQAEIDRLAKTP